MAGNVVVKVENYGYIRGQDGASAYEQAVAGGYEGTEEQFEQDLASVGGAEYYASLAAEAKEAAEAAAESVSESAEQISQNTSDISDLMSAVESLKEKAIKRSGNLFDKNNANLIKGYFGATILKIKHSLYTWSLFIPCAANADYVISRNNGFYTNRVGCTEAIPAIGVDIIPIDAVDSATVDGVTYTHIHTTQNANYIVLYYCNANHDEDGAHLTYLDSIMISEGREYRQYRDYEASFVKYHENVPVNTYGIFGIKFKRNAENPAMMRTFDAQGMTFRQQIGEAVARSDFDNAFPWCEMRECNVTIDGSGEKTIVYSGETGFSRSQNTFIEVPAFYFKRTVVNDVEEWAVSGRPFSGADIEPWFLNSDGSIAKYRYLAKYEGCDLVSTDLSISGEYPKTGVGLLACKTHCENSGAKLMSIQAWLAISHLMVIEFCTFHLQAYNVGISYLPYSMSSSTWNKPVNTGTGNTVVLNHSASDKKLTYLNVGDTIYLSETGGQIVTDPRTITSITINSNTQITIEFSGSPYEITANTRAYPAMQPTGKTDAMTYHTGRPLDNDMNSSFLYRGLENIYGNTWTFADGITWQQSDGSFDIADKVPSFTAPYQFESGNDNTTEGWITKLGYDRAMPWATLTETVLGTTSETGNDSYITDEWSTRPNGTGPNPAAVGGGWDHQGENGMFCMRIGDFDVNDNWIYGYRAMID